LCNKKVDNIINKTKFKKEVQKYPDCYRVIRKIYYNIKETIYRLNSNNYFVITDKRKVTFFLPHKGDYIQQIIIVQKSFYELTYLRMIEKYIDCTSIVIDIGSNIGNHAVYFGRIIEVKKMYLFEPCSDVFNVLRKNIYLNKLNSKTELYNFALGSKNSKAKINLDGKKYKNLGLTSIKESDIGDIKIKKLDDIDIIENKVDLIKIDVEGFEIEVLKGALVSIQKYRPIIWIETFKDKYKYVVEIFESISYVLLEALGDENYIFAPAENTYDIL